MSRRESHSAKRKQAGKQRRAAARRDRRSEPREPDLLREVRRRLGTGDPLDLLAEASMLIASLDPRSQDPMRRAAPDRELPGVAELLRTFAEVDRIETSALLTAAAQLAPDELTRAYARKQAAGRRQMLPAWLRQLDQAEAYRCMAISDVLGDGDDVLIAVRLDAEHELTALLYIDHNLGGVAKDGFVISRPIDELARMMHEQGDAPVGVGIADLGRADARARITEAIEHGAMLYPPFESETWPMSRPLVEWIARLLPEGGRSYERVEWDEPARQRLTSAFFDSEFGRALTHAHQRSMFESILWYGTDYGPGDPLHWSPVAVEILLLDWIPRKIIAPTRELETAPEILRRLIRYAHAQRDIPAARTVETLEAVDAFEPEYQELIRSARPQGPMALLASIGAIDPTDAYELPDDEEEFDLNEYMLELLRAEVGSEQALSTLTAAPLPDEGFAWTGIDADIHPKVSEVLELCDGCCEQLLDIEYRTACRRYLALIARGDAEAFRRRGRAQTAAAAVVWTIGTANDLFHPSRGRMLVKDLLPHFGITQGGVSQRAATLLKASRLRSADDPAPAWEIKLGTPDLLVSSRRQRIIEQRDRYSD